MDVKALAILIGSVRAGVLFQYALPGSDVITRFVADDAFAMLPEAPTVSLSWLAEAPEDQPAFWRALTAPALNGRRGAAGEWLLPAVFQNLLPEGVFRDHIAAIRQCSPKDHFNMLAACGADLPGNLYALPVELDRQSLARYVTQNQDALEMTVLADPMDEGVSLSGVQPKLGVIREGDRYVGRTKDRDTHIIAKLPVTGKPQLPEVECLSLELARSAGVDTCQAYLEPLSALAAQHDYDLTEATYDTRFLAVIRYDRSPQGRVHCEDFAQILGVAPDDKYRGASYLDVAATLMAFDTMGETAVHELLRRLVVNELLGNPDMHLKNMGVIYPDGVHPRLAPAYDIVAYAAYMRCHGHALTWGVDAAHSGTRRVPASSSPGAAQAAKPLISPSRLRAFCARLGIPEKPAAHAISSAVRQAVAHWPEQIAASALTPRQKTRLTEHFESHSAVIALRRRQSRSSAA